MAKFDPEHATVPDTNFSERNSAERFLESGKFRPCANLLLPLIHQPSFPVNVYIPVCAKSRFNKTGVAQHLLVPDPGSRIVSPEVYTTVAKWAPHISCPRKCKGYRNKRWAALADALRRMFRGRQSGQPGTAQGNASNDGPLTKAMNNGWVQGLGGLSIAALIAFLVAIWFHTGVKEAAITLAATGTATALVFVMAVVRYWDSRL